MAGKFFKLKQKKPIRRKRSGSSRYFIYFIAAMLVVTGFIWGLRSIFTRLSFFEIDHISIEGNLNLETEFLENLAHDFLKQNLYATSKRDILKKYDNIIRIKDISITRIFPNKIRLTIHERSGKFFVKNLEGLVIPIDNDRIILDHEAFYGNENLPVIEIDYPAEAIVVGKKIENEFVEKIFAFCADVEKVYPEFINNISEFYEDKDEIFLVEANLGYRIVFGEDELLDKVKRYKFLEQNRTFERGKIVDLRFKNQLVIRSEVE